MRERGVRVRDARFDKHGDLIRWVDIAGSEEIAAVRAAAEACAPKVATVDGEQSHPDPRFEAALVDFVACMRREGIANMPDPGPEGVDLRGTGIDPRDPAFRAAENVCYRFLEEFE